MSVAGHGVAVVDLPQRSRYFWNDDAPVFREAGEMVNGLEKAKRFIRFIEAEHPDMAPFDREFNGLYYPSL